MNPATLAKFVRAIAELLVQVIEHPEIIEKAQAKERAAQPQRTPSRKDKGAEG